MSATGIPIDLNALADANGAPLSGFKAYSWVPDSAGDQTGTPRTLYSDPACTTPATNPAVGNAAGYAVVYKKAGEPVTIVIKSSDDATTYATKFYPALLVSGDDLDDMGAVRVCATYAEMTALAAAKLTDGCEIEVQARASAGDGGEGPWRWDAASTATANGGTILAHDTITPGRFIRIYSGPVHIEWFGADNTGAADSSLAVYNAAMAAFGTGNAAAVVAGPGAFLWSTHRTITMPNPAEGTDDTNAFGSLVLRGAGTDVTIFKCGDNDWLSIVKQSQQHLIDLDDFTVTTNQLGTRTGLSLSNTAPFFGTFTGKSRIGITMRGENGYANTQYWGTAVTCENVNHYNWEKFVCFGASTPAGVAVEIDNPEGSGCLTIDANCQCAHNIDFDGGHFAFLAVAIRTRRHVQSLKLRGTIVVQTGKVLDSPYYAGNTLQDYQLINVTGYCTDDIFDLASPIRNLVVLGGLYAISPGKKGFKLRNYDTGYIGGGAQFFPYGDANSPDAAIDLDDYFDGEFIIGAVQIISCGTGIRLGSNSERVTISAEAMVGMSGNTVDVVDNGTDNVVHSFVDGVFSSSLLVGATATAINGVAIFHGDTNKNVAIGNGPDAAAFSFVNDDNTDYTNGYLDADNIINREGGFRSRHATQGIGYGIGAGGTVTQTTSKTTGVTLNQACGQITTNNAALAAGAEAAFTVTNSAVASTDLVYPVVGNANYLVRVTDTANGSFSLRLKNNTAGSLGDAVVVTFIVLKAVAA